MLSTYTPNSLGEQHIRERNHASTLHLVHVQAMVHASDSA